MAVTIDRTTVRLYGWQIQADENNITGDITGTWSYPVMGSMQFLTGPIVLGIDLETGFIPIDDVQGAFDTLAGDAAYTLTGAWPS